jgi:DNA topoisomerase-1
MEAYCLKCKTKREMLNPTPVYNQNGSAATTGPCAVCGSKLFKMGLTDAHATLVKPTPTAKTKTAPTKAKTKTTAAKTSTTKSKTTAAKGKTAAAKTSTTKGKTTKTTAPTRRSGKLVIVESPAKAKSVGRYLGAGYTVKASKGHVRDLYKSKLSVDLDNAFTPTYTVPIDKKATVTELRKAAETASEIYLATDPDREGEAIAWHLIHAAGMDESRIKRVVFHEITEPAVKEAFSHPRQVDMSLVNAQQARRILDRIVGYQVSELLWTKVRGRLSAGRVQSIALRLVVDRERQIESFVPQEYWTVDVDLKKQTGIQRPFSAHLVKIDGQDPDFSAEAQVTPHLAVLERSRYTVSDIARSQMQRKPAAPFTTSTLQQEASRRLGFNARRTMSAAQQLYEGIDLGKEGTVGLITYMRTDSVNVSAQAQTEARAYIQKRFGKDHVPAKPPVYKTKAKGAQEAHEAIRPTSIEREPTRIKAALSSDQFKLYKLIWERFVASQMSNAIYDTLKVEITAGPTPQQQPYLLRASTRQLAFAGFMAVYEEGKDDETTDGDEGRVIPPLEVQEPLDLVKLLPEQHFTEPPPRYTEATLVKALEEYGIGRPSTYAPTLGVIQDRDYVEVVNKRMVPTEIGKLVNDLLVQFFPDVMDYSFTARMEDQLDSVAEGDIEWQPVLSTFYDRFAQQLETAKADMPRIQPIEKIGRTCPTCGTGDLIIKHGRYGKFIGCSNYPECKHTEPYVERTGVMCAKCGATDGGELLARKTRAGRTFFGCSRYPDCDYTTWRLPKVNKAGILVIEDEGESPTETPKRRRTG